jgi:adenylosuccinate synthase
MTSLALIGGQYGSEGKGVIAAGLAHHFRAAVRTGGPNAGHSFYHRGELFKMRQVPCAWVNPGASLMIGAGAVLDPELLQAETHRVKRLVVVDAQATIISKGHHAAEQMRGLREKIGSTTEGVGAARIDKIRREGDAILAKDYKWTSEWIEVGDIADALDWQRRNGNLIMLEGTQGALLSLHHGRYPFTTSHDTNAAQLAADAGLPPSDVEHTHLVVRTHPIRVAGNSGPTGGEEMAWEDLPPGAADVPERTTVTNNVRRLFRFDQDDFDRAILLNDPCGVWVTFGDYLDPAIREARDIDEAMDIPAVRDWVRENIYSRHLRLLGIGAGGNFWRVIETGDACFRPGHHHSQAWELRQEGGTTDDLPF